MKQPTSLVLILAVTILSGCASMERMLPLKKKERADEIKELRERIVELQQRATMAEVELERLRREVAEMEGKTASTSPDSKVASPDIVELESEADESRTPSTATEFRREGEPRIEVIEVQSDEADELPGVDEDPILDAGEGPAEQLAADSGVARVPSEGGSESAALSDAGQALYDRGYTLFHQGRYLDAETTFQQFLSSFGSTDLGDNAQFWIGEARYGRGDFSGALAAFREVVTRFPEGNKVPDALLKAADCRARLGDLGGARKGYSELIESYPTAAAAAVAEDRLRALE